MLATVHAATLQGIDGRVIRVEVDVAPGLPGVHDRRPARRRAPGSARAGAWRDPQQRPGVPAPSDHGQPRPGRPAQGRRVARPGDRRRDPAGLRAGPRGRAAGRSSASCRSVASCGRCRACCRWSRRSPAAACDRVVVPAASAAEAALVDGVDVRPAASLGDVVGLLRSPRSLPPAPRPPARVELSAAGATRSNRARSRRRRGCTGSRGRPMGPTSPTSAARRDGRRALEIALAGGHGLLMIGPPGIGQDAARADDPAAAAAARDDEARGRVDDRARRPARARSPASSGRRPFRAPHHTISYAGMVGGGPRLRPAR